MTINKSPIHVNLGLVIWFGLLWILGWEKYFLLERRLRILPHSAFLRWTGLDDYPGLNVLYIT